MSLRPGATRRAVLVSAAALAAGCEPVPPLQGGWLGSSEARGHALRDGRWPSPSSAGEPQRCSVAIVGAGVAGLAAARALQRQGVDDFRLFDLEDEPGGNARGHAMGGLACPLGAHYLPVPGPAAWEVSEWLHEIGVARRRFGRTEYDERTLCHAPQERLFMPGQGASAAGGQWLPGLMPVQGDSRLLRAQARRFAAELRRHQAAGSFAMPTLRAPWSAELAALDAQTFATWLAAHGYTEAPLLWHLDYCCRDDYGAGSAQVSAWAGLHYFASRHGLRVPGSADGTAVEEGDDTDGVLTWPEGNAWLTRRLAVGLGDRLRTATSVTRVSPGKHGVSLDTWHAPTQQAQRWQARQVLLCLPLHVAARLVDPPPAALAAAAARLPHAPWLVSNLHLNAPLLERLGPPMAWDNVLAGRPSADLPPALGYVNATHQSLASRPQAALLTHYWALGGDTPEQARQWRRALLAQPWQAWAQHVLADLARAHPDLPSKLARIDLMRYGHAMGVPVPGVRGDVAAGALAALARPQDRLHFAHADLSGYSVFEEAFTRGTLAGQAAAQSKA
jgi:monoamine oxidase